jgi:hypothetical protein
VFLVRYDLGFISQKTELFIVTAVKTSNLTSIRIVCAQLKLGSVAFRLLAVIWKIGEVM